VDPKSGATHRVWIPGSLASLAPRNDEKLETIFRLAAGLSPAAAQ
jgi:hypothetical protein